MTKIRLRVTLRVKIRVRVSKMHVAAYTFGLSNLRIVTFRLIIDKNPQT